MWLHSVVHFVLSFICCFCILLSCNSADCHRERVFIPVIYRPFFLLMKGLKNDFVRNILWTFEDIHMLVGSNMPIFGGGRYPAVSLRLRWILKLTSLYVPALTEFCVAFLFNYLLIFCLILKCYTEFKEENSCFRLKWQWHYEVLVNRKSHNCAIALGREIFCCFF